MAVKVLGSTINITGNIAKKAEELGMTNSHNQVRIICKCKSMADANRKCAAMGLYDKTFTSAFTCETGNAFELALCEESDIWIRLKQPGNKREDWARLEDLIGKDLPNERDSDDMEMEL